MSKTKAQMQADYDVVVAESEDVCRERNSLQYRLDGANEDTKTMKGKVAELVELVARLEGYIHRVQEIEDRDVVLNSPPAEVKRNYEQADYMAQLPRRIQRHRDNIYEAMGHSNQSKEKEWWEV